MDTLFDSPCRYMSDSELLYEISNNRQIVSDIERSNEVIDLEKLFSSLTPGRDEKGEIVNAVLPDMLDFISGVEDKVRLRVKRHMIP